MALLEVVLEVLLALFSLEADFLTCAINLRARGNSFSV